MEGYRGCKGKELRKADVTLKDISRKVAEGEF